MSDKPITIDLTPDYKKMFQSMQREILPAGQEMLKAPGLHNFHRFLAPLTIALGSASSAEEINVLRADLSALLRIVTDHQRAQQDWER